ncbi:hypothetical protein TNCV_4284781 [Trichonephila clavipes]|uniref:Uncharacterized protein n=1 Tax=Trichonephila clavipes TaxID=2585209 RepID=A0A8X6SJX6_TRICX|nr:hypothetical protein TNCV_4284781 [Trichonephila clavipes]
MPPFYQPQFNHPNSRAANREPTHLHPTTNHRAPYPLVNPELSLRTFFPAETEGASAQDVDVTLLPHQVHQSPCHSRH